MAKTGPLRTRNSPDLRLVDKGPYQVRRQQVGGELDALVVAVERLRERRRRARLRQPRRALDEHVTVGEQPDEQAFEHVFLARRWCAPAPPSAFDEGALFTDARVDFPHVKRHVVSQMMERGSVAAAL